MKTVCENCDWQGDSADLLCAGDPFIPGDTLTACPKCRTLNNTVRVACDESGCWAPATCGTPTRTSYRRTCDKHFPQGAPAS